MVAKSTENMYNIGAMTQAELAVAKVDIDSMSVLLERAMKLANID